MARQPSAKERFTAFADEQNAAAVRGGLFRRGIGHPGDIHVDEERTTLRDLLSPEVLRSVRRILGDIPADREAALIDAINNDVARATDAAEDIIKREDPEMISMLDAITLGRTTDHDIDKFLSSLKRDPSSERHAAFISELMQEAIDYFDGHIGGDVQTVHANLRNTSIASVRNLFRVAAGQDRRLLVPQACALLRIMAVINFIKADPKLSLIPQVNSALEAFARRHIKKRAKGEGCVFQTGAPEDEAVPLWHHELRPKTMESTTTKLLIKPSNRTDEVTDHIGGRFITRTPRDVLRLIHIMFFHANAPLPSINIIVSRGKTKMSITPSDIQSAVFEGDDDGAIGVFEDLSQPMEEDDDNPHSLAQYKAIHITFDMPIETEAGKVVTFPVEFQFLYLAAHQANEVQAPHVEYKRGQRNSATDRAMGNNLSTAFQNEQTKEVARARNGATTD